MQNTLIAAALERVTCGPATVAENLTMVPLLLKEGDVATPTAPADSRLDYLILDDALGKGVTEITEVSEQGSVPNLRVVNRAAMPVLIVDGQELVGAKQNRVVNLSILVGAQSTLTIPVSCVEAGRWRARSRAFMSAPRTQYSSGRARRVAQVSMSMMVRGDRLSDQADVWADIAEKSRRLDAHSPTAAMESLYVDHSSSIDVFVERCQPIDRQIGALFAIDEAIVALDLFDRPSTLAGMLPKLVRGVAVDAIDARSADRVDKSGGELPPLSTTVQQFLAIVAGAAQHTAKAIGLGDDVRLTAPHLTGAALAVNEHVIHLSAFALDG